MATSSLTRQREATYQLAIRELFDNLTQREKLYAHHLARAAWHGSRIILRQTSPEGTGIFDFILKLHKACGGQWNKLVNQYGVKSDELDAFLEFSGLFLTNLGNYFASNSCHIPSYHLLNMHREKEIGMLYQMFLLILSARLPVSRLRQLLLWRRLSNQCCRSPHSALASPTRIINRTTTLAKNESPEKKLLQLLK